MRKNDIIEIEDLKFRKQTPLAIMVSDGDGDIWLPKSQIISMDPEDPDPGDIITVEIPEWLAEEKELI